MGLGAVKKFDKISLSGTSLKYVFVTQILVEYSACGHLDQKNIAGCPCKFSLWSDNAKISGYIDIFFVIIALRARVH